MKADQHIYDFMYSRIPEMIRDKVVLEIATGPRIACQARGAGAQAKKSEPIPIVLSLNGFHAFPDKEAAYRETCRVLKKGGVFCGRFCIAGEFARTDYFVKKMYVPKGFFIHFALAVFIFVSNHKRNGKSGMIRLGGGINRRKTCRQRRGGKDFTAVS